MGTVIDLAEIRNQSRYICPECRKKGKFCPPWIHSINDNDFEELSLKERLEWLYHTRSGS